MVADERAAGINGLEDIADEVEAALDEGQAFASELQEVSNEREVASVEDETFIDAGADIASVGEDAIFSEQFL